ncbi:MAG TPA: TadE/TadG family type IV pilus assembly protein [Actinomycetota bacterium]|nr:TadE/TadG family type IV pilus assembly protein [Actinomycetota bacterium]
MEAALALPVVLISLLLIVQVGIVVRDALALGLAAREGAREAAVTALDERVRAAVRRSAGPLDASGIAVEVTPPQGERHRAGPVTVRLSYVERMRIPIVSRMLTTTLTLRAQAVMRLERDGPTPAPTPQPTPAPTTSPAPSQTPEPTPSMQPDPTPNRLPIT